MQIHFAALGIGFARGLDSMWQALHRFLAHPISEASHAFVDAASLILHPIRNLTHTLEALERFGDKSLDEKLMSVGEELPYLAIAPLVIPWFAQAKSRIRESEARSERRRLAEMVQAGIGAPLGQTSVGSAVNRAVWGTRHGTVGRELAISQGTLDAVWVNMPSENGIHQVCELIAREAKYEVCIQTYIFDYDSPAANELLGVLADKQHTFPTFRVNFLIDHPGNFLTNPPGIRAAFARHGLRVNLAAARPPWSRRGAHTKMFVIDSRYGVIGGDNIDNPKEKDLLIQVSGPVIRAFLADFDDAWRHAVQRLAGPITPPPHPPVQDVLFPESIPMTLLGKHGMLGLYARDYEQNDADQGLLAAMSAARHLIQIESPNLNADPVLRAIQQAAERGVKVQICLPLDYLFLQSTFDATNNRAFLSFWAHLPPDARENVELRNFSTDGIHPEHNHTKFLAIDREWAYVGSQNMDNQSFAFSRELGLGLDDHDTALRLVREVFERDWGTSLPVTPGFFDRLMPHALFDH